MTTPRAYNRERKPSGRGRNTHPCYLHGPGNALGNGLCQQWNPVRLRRRNPHRRHPVIRTPLKARSHLQPINLVVDQDLGNIAGADLPQHRINLLHAFTAPRVAGIDHVQQYGGLACLGQRRTKRSDQFMRQITNETDGVRHHGGRTTGQTDAAHRGIQRGE